MCSRLFFTSCQKFGFEAIKYFITVMLKLCHIFLPDDIEVALWKAVSATKLIFEIGHSLGCVNSLASMWPSAFWVGISIDTLTGISTVNNKCNVTDTGHALYTYKCTYYNKLH